MAVVERIPGPSVRDYPRAAWDLIFGDKEPVRGTEAHLEATMSWLCRAQDTGGDRGLARMYHVRRGWGASYPETTGYAIPTFLAYGRFTGNEVYRRRALDMADWESEVQLPSGAVQGGVTTDSPSPAIFNTGQVLFGWCAAYGESQNARYRDSALRAAKYLCDDQDADGAWRKNLSAFCDAPSASYTYNARTAWALMLAYVQFGNEELRSAAEANIDFVLSRAHDNGWLDDNCLSRPEQPLLHTIAYTYQGMLELSTLANNSSAHDLVVRGNEELLACFRKLGRLHGRYDKSWNPTVGWRCLTGEAQTAIVWHRLADITSSGDWKNAARELLVQLKRTQSLSGPLDIRGAVKGSHPITGAYGRLEYPNWAAKFFADALMLELGAPGAAVSG